MSDRPLFQDSDKEEATYAPQQLPGGTEQVATDDGTPVSDSTLPVVALPLAATGAAAGSAGPGYAGGSTGTVGGVMPAIGALAIAEEAEKNDEAERRD